MRNATVLIRLGTRFHQTLYFLHALRRDPYRFGNCVHGWKRRFDSDCHSKTSRRVSVYKLRHASTSIIGSRDPRFSETFCWVFVWRPRLLAHRK
jgi:hypothetical protein